MWIIDIFKSSNKIKSLEDNLEFLNNRIKIIHEAVANHEINQEKIIMDKIVMSLNAAFKKPSEKSTIKILSEGCWLIGLKQALYQMSVLMDEVDFWPPDVTYIKGREKLRKACNDLYDLVKEVENHA